MNEDEIEDFLGSVSEKDKTEMLKKIEQMKQAVTDGKDTHADLMMSMASNMVSNSPNLKTNPADLIKMFQKLTKMYIESRVIPIDEDTELDMSAHIFPLLRFLGENITVKYLDDESNNAGG